MRTLPALAITVFLQLGFNAAAEAQAPAGPVELGRARAAAEPSQAEKDIRAKLEQEGYAEVSNLIQDKDGWMATAVRDGERVILDIDNAGNIAITR